MIMTRGGSAGGTLAQRVQGPLWAGHLAFAVLSVDDRPRDASLPIRQRHRRPAASSLVDPAAFDPPPVCPRLPLLAARLQIKVLRLLHAVALHLAVL